ncbi:phage tail tape measure protein [Desulfocastanea catecholica]
MADKDMKLRLLIEAKNQADAELKKLEKEIGQVSSETDALGKKGKTSGDMLSGGFSTAAAGVGVFAAVVTAAATGVSALVVSSANEQRELENLSRLAKMGSQDFAAYAFATEKVGINAEQLADISKDVQDKLGDFVATGGGEFADFFENVAPKVGLTAEALQQLSGPEVLVAVKKAMDDANISAAEQVFYLEAIGNDASKLIPILANNGKELKKNADRAREFGVSLSEIDEQKLLDAKDATDDTTAAFGGLKKKVAAEFAPAFTAVMEQAARLLVEVRGEAEALAAPFANIVQSLSGWAAVGSGRMTLLQFAAMDAKELSAWLGDDRKGLHDIGVEILQLQEEQKKIASSSHGNLDLSTEQKQRLKEITEEIALLRQQEQEFKQVTAAKSELARAAGGTGTAAGESAAVTTTNAETVAYNKGRIALQKYIETQKQRIQKEYDSVISFAKTDEERAAALAQYNAQMAAISGNEKSRTQELGKQKKLVEEIAKKEAERAEALRQSMQATNLHIQALNGIQNAKSVPVDPWMKLIDLGKEYDETIVGIDKELADFFDGVPEQAERGRSDMEIAVTGWASSFSGTLTDMLTGADTNFKAIANSFANMILQMIIQKKLIEPMLEGLFGGTSGAAGGSTGSWITSAFGAVASAFAAAQGGVPSGTGISALSNQVVSRPTYFAFAAGGVPSLGVAGEVPGKSEGIFPLTRTSTGNLGVEAVMQSTERAPDNKTQELLRELIGAVQGQGNVRIVNTIDNGSIVNAMSSAAGERMILNTITRNPSLVRRAVGG